MEKLINYLNGKKLDELSMLRGLVSSICGDYDKSLTTYATINDDKFFQHMPRDIEDMHKRRTKLFELLMQINKIIEEKLFKLYE